MFVLWCPSWDLASLSVTDTHHADRRGVVHSLRSLVSLSPTSDPTGCAVTPADRDAVARHTENINYIYAALAACSGTPDGLLKTYTIIIISPKLQPNRPDLFYL